MILLWYHQSPSFVIDVWSHLTHQVFVSLNPNVFFSNLAYLTNYNSRWHCHQNWSLGLQFWRKMPGGLVFPIFMTDHAISHELFQFYGMLLQRTFNDCKNYVNRKSQIIRATAEDDCLPSVMLLSNKGKLLVLLLGGSVQTGGRSIVGCWNRGSTRR